MVAEAETPVTPVTPTPEVAEPAVRANTFQALDDAKFSRAHVKAICIAGSGFFVDSYDNFIIGLMVPMIAYEYFHESALQSTADGWIKAMSSWGNVIGQISFAVAGDVLGRKKVYGIEQIILIIGACLCAFATWPIAGSANNVLISLGLFRFILGIGIGGDYPVSAVITSEFASTQHRGTMIATVFAMQGFGILAGAIIAVATLAIFKNSILENGESSLGYCWRFLAFFGAVPPICTVYWRLRMPETPRYAMHVLKDADAGAHATEAFLATDQQVYHTTKIEDKKGFFAEFGIAFKTHFHKWDNLKVLLGCALAWFFLDIGYYGTSLNTPRVLEIIGYGKPTSTGNQKIYDDLWSRAVGAAVINMCGTVPGYWFTVFFVDKWGRKPIQYLGFTMLTILFLILAIFLNQLKNHQTVLFVILYAFAQFFFNFGPNATTFIIPAEVFPTKVRSTGHGLSAASGKIGAILAAQCFSVLANGSMGLKGVLYIFSACCFFGLLASLWIPETKSLTLEQLSAEDDQDEAAELEKGAMGYKAVSTPTAV